MRGWEYFYLTLAFIFIPYSACSSYQSPDTSQSAQTVEKSNVASSSVEQAKQHENFVKGEIIVKFKDNATEKQIERINSSLNTKVKQKIPVGKNTFLLKLPEGLPVTKAVEKYQKLSKVEYAEPNFIQRAR